MMIYKVRMALPPLRSIVRLSYRPIVSDTKTMIIMASVIRCHLEKSRCDLPNPVLHFYHYAGDGYLL